MTKRKLSTFLPVLVMVIFLVVFFSSSPFLVNSYSLLNAEAFSGYSQYTVKSGDSLFIIARQYGISVEDLKRANALTSDILIPGQILKVPGQQFPWKEDKPLWRVLMEKGITNPEPGLKIVVYKSDHTLSLLYGDTWLKSYHTEFGEGGMGTKRLTGTVKLRKGLSIFLRCQF